MSLLKNIKYVQKYLDAARTPSITHHVKNFQAQQYKEAHHDTVKAIIHNHYVDDYVAGYTDVIKALEVSKQVRNILEYSGFLLKGFI